jgi:hypothetical protein
MKGASLGRFLALPSNITLGWNGFPGTNTLAYCVTFINDGRKRFYNNGPWRQG